MKAPEPTPESLEKARELQLSRAEPCEHDVLPTTMSRTPYRRVDCRPCLALALDEAVRDTKERAAQIAMGSTGPGNTIDQCAGYSAACRDIAKRIREV